MARQEDLDQSLADSVSNQESNIEEINVVTTKGDDCIGDNKNKQWKFLSLVAAGLVFMTFIQLLFQALIENQILYTQLFKYFYISDAISIILFVLFGILSIACVVVSKITWWNSFLVYFTFFLGWTAVNFMIFLFEKINPGDVYINLINGYVAMLQRVFFVQLSFLITILIFWNYFNLLLGIPLILLFYFLSYYLLREVFFKGFLAELYDFDQVVDILILLTLTAYYYFQTKIVVNKRQYYYSSRYWGNGVIDYMTDIFWIFWYNLFFYKGPSKQINIKEKELKVIDYQDNFAAAKPKPDENNDFY